MQNMDVRRTQCDCWLDTEGALSRIAVMGVISRKMSTSDTLRKLLYADDLAVVVDDLAVVADDLAVVADGEVDVKNGW